MQTSARHATHPDQDDHQSRSLAHHAERLARQAARDEAARNAEFQRRQRARDAAAAKAELRAADSAARLSGLLAEIAERAQLALTLQTEEDEPALLMFVLAGIQVQAQEALSAAIAVDRISANPVGWDRIAAYTNMTSTTARRQHATGRLIIR